MANNIFNFTVDNYDCEVNFASRPITIFLRKQHIVLYYNWLGDFMLNKFSTTTVGYKIIKLGKKEEVTASKVANLLHIGCFTITESEFKKLYNLIKYKKNELLRQSGN